MEINTGASQQEIQKREISFQHHLKTYIQMIFFFWILWFFVGWRYSYFGMPWPVVPLILWIPALIIHYFIFNPSKKITEQ